ncbi:MAG: hypothetical protein COB23_09735 [Methylophaga sp.]|nr:MAG: hypothetical protein COB23_09735 [Methylophaga sp.]
MNNKAQELDMRNIMQGMEEFATFMSFQSNSGSLRILSVETVEQSKSMKTERQMAQVLTMPRPALVSANDQSLHRSLSFQDRQVN